MLVVAPLLTWRQLDEDMNEGECLEYLNILDDELILETYRRYKLAGAQCVCTNTLKANRTALQAFGLEDALVDINQAGVMIARDAGFEHIIATMSLAKEEDLLEQLAALLPEDPEAIWLIGNAEADELNAAIGSIKSQTDLPLIAAAAANGITQGADIIYVMGASLKDSLDELRSLAQHYKEPLMICPDPGTPEGATKIQRNRAINNLADDMADFALEAQALGAQFVGTAPGSRPVFTGTAAAILAGMDVVQGDGAGAPHYVG